jgi:hypothetical protein
VVRGPAAVLVVTAAAWAYFLAPKLLPAISNPETSRIVAGTIACVLIVAVAGGVATLADAAFVVPVILLGGALVAGAMNAAHVGAAATVPETVVYACIGILFSVVLEAPALAFAIPIFVAGVDIISVLGASGHGVAHGLLRGGDPLTLELPDWHNGLAAARIGLADVVFAGAYAAFARRMELRFVTSAIGMAIGLAVGLAISIAQDTPLPELAFLGAGFLIPNVDRLVDLFRPTPAG